MSLKAKKKIEVMIKMMKVGSFLCPILRHTNANLGKFEMKTLLRQYMTPVHDTHRKIKIDHSSKLLFVGSCFSENMSEAVQSLRFQILANVQGILCKCYTENFCLGCWTRFCSDLFSSCSHFVMTRLTVDNLYHDKIA